MTAEEISSSAPEKLRPQVETLARAVAALQRKIEEQIPIYDRLPIAQTMTTTQGEKVLKANPAMLEFRATVRDYASSLRNLADIIDAEAEAPAEINKLEDFRTRFKVG